MSVSVVSVICDITSSLETNTGPVFNIHKYDVGTLNPPVQI